MLYSGKSCLWKKKQLCGQMMCLFYKESISLCLCMLCSSICYDGLVRQYSVFNYEMK